MSTTRFHLGWCYTRSPCFNVCGGCGVQEFDAIKLVKFAASRHQSSWPSLARPLGTPAFVQAQGAPSKSEAQTPPAQSSATIRSIQVVDVKELQPAVRTKVDEIVAQTSEQDLQSLRQSIDAAPAAVSALKAKGLSSSQVVAINVSDGVLTLFAKTV